MFKKVKNPFARKTTKAEVKVVRINKILWKLVFCWIDRKMNVFRIINDKETPKNGK